MASSKIFGVSVKIHKTAKARSILVRKLAKFSVIFEAAICFFSYALN